MRYLDANVFIYAAASSDAFGDNARHVLRHMVSGARPAVTAVLALDEVAWAIRKIAGTDVAVLETTRLLGLPHLTVLDVKAKHMVAALDLMERHASLRPRDALHAAVAIDAGVFTIVSSDDDFDVVPELTRTGLA